MVLPLRPLFPKRPLLNAPAPFVAPFLRLARKVWPPTSRKDDEKDDVCIRGASLGSLPRGSSRAVVGCRSAECCRTLDVIISLKERSFSDLRGAVLIGMCWAYIRSVSTYLVLGEESRGLCSSPLIDLVLLNRLNGFGFVFLAKFADVGVAAYARG